MIITAHTQQRPSPDPKAPPVQRDEIQVEAPDYEAGRAAVMENLPDGWVVSGWQVDRS